jgi:amino-acid N-acetyltransferase
MRARRAVLPDAPVIEKLIRVHSSDGTLLPRTLADINENIRDFYVVEDDSGVIGCGALHLYGIHLAEIRSITVRTDVSKRGAGKLLVESLMWEASHQHVGCVCLFTRIPTFFEQFGFRMVERTSLPDKIYKDCLNCPRLHACDEFAMVRGELPKFAILGPRRISNTILPGLARPQ